MKIKLNLLLRNILVLQKHHASGIITCETNENKSKLISLSFSIERDSITSYQFGKEPEVHDKLQFCVVYINYILDFNLILSRQ